MDSYRPHFPAKRIIVCKLSITFPPVGVWVLLDLVVQKSQAELRGCHFGLQVYLVTVIVNNCADQ